MVERPDSEQADTISSPLPAQADVVVIGAGIVGLAVALELTRRHPGVSVVVIEKETTIAAHQTSHNSGVIHSGIYYKPGTLKATLCVQGSKALMNFCAENQIPFEVCGKVIVANDDSESARLRVLFERGQGNGIKGLKMLCAEQIREVEPHARGCSGIHVPTAAIVDYRKVAEAYARVIAANGGAICLGSEVIALLTAHRETVIETLSGAITASVVINCAGLQSDRVSSMTDHQRDIAIIPFRGEYYQLVKEKRSLVKGLLYPVPDPQFPFLGVHFTKRINSEVEAGPNAVLALSREGYSKRSFSFRDVGDITSFPGFWKMAAQHWKMSLGEYHRSFNKRAFVHALQRLLPDLQEEDLLEAGSGVRAQALSREGKLLDDFCIICTDSLIHVRNVPSPAATASLAIGRYIVDLVSHEMKDHLPQLAGTAPTHVSCS